MTSVSRHLKNSQTTAMTCTVCAGTETKYWRGKRAGKPICQACYVKKRKALGKSPMRKTKVYDSWGGL